MSTAPRFQYGLGRCCLPATTIADTEAAVLAAEYLLNVCDALAIPSARAAAAAEAVMELSDNALRAAPGPDLPVVAATITGSPRTIRVAVTDAGETISEAANPQALLHAMPHARGGNGFLPTLLRKGDRFGFKVRIEIFAGTARLRWWWSGRQAPLGTRHIPGTT